MKFSFLVFAFITFQLYSQNWTWVNGSNTSNPIGSYGTIGISANNNSPVGRCGATTWTDASGNIWVFGGSSSVSSYERLADLWKYNISTNQWTWVKGPNTPNFVGQYGAMGVSNSFNCPGARAFCVGWNDNQGNLWLFGGHGFSGNDIGKLGDLWKYNIANNEWTWMKGQNTVGHQGNFGVLGIGSNSNEPSAREISHGFYYNGNLYLFGGNGVSSFSSGSLNDMWRYNIALNQWTWIKGSNSSTSSNNYGTINVESTSNTPCGRENGAYTTDGNGNFYFYGGENYPNQYYADLWKYNAITNNWIWIKGSSTVNIQYTIGTQNTYAPANTPGSRCAAVLSYTSCGLFFHGGYQTTSSSGNTGGDMSDMWQFNVSNGNWRFLKGGTGWNQAGIYGTIGTSGTINRPGSRQYSSLLTDNEGNLWLFGGVGRAATSTYGVLNDLSLFKIINETIVPNNTTLCSGSNPGITSSSSHNSIYSWQAISNPNISGETNSLTIGNTINDNLQNTTNTSQSIFYTITPISNAGCIGVNQTISLSINPTPTVNAGADQTVFAGSSITLAGSGATTYSWNNSVTNNTPFTATATTTYTVTGTSNGCTATDQVL